jgi:ribose transport system substrate-binding protein
MIDLIRSRIFLSRMFLVLASSLAAASAGRGEDGPSGITRPQVLEPFKPDAPGCHKPKGLKKALAFAQDNQRQFMEGVSYGLSMAAKDRDLGYQVLLANSDATKQIAQLQQLRATKIGAVVASPVDPPSLAHSLQELIWSGVYVGTVVPPPAITLLNAPQYLTGKTLGDAAAAYIRDHFAGRADVVLLTQDSLEFLAPRFAAIRNALKDMPGVNIVGDISPNPVNEKGGLATMRIILEAHPEIDVVLGADTVVLGALAALREAGKDRPDQFLGGIDGEPKAIAEIKRANSPYKASVALSSPVFGYALGIHAADWLAGKSVPQAMDILPIVLTTSNLAQYETDLANPGSVYADAARRATYLKMYGNICHDTRERYLNFPWSSEKTSP